MSKYIKVEDLQKFCDNSKEHSITPNEFQRMTQIELPDKHGRIIDEKWVELYVSKYFSIEFPNGTEKVYNLLKLALKDVPTILEASE